MKKTVLMFIAFLCIKCSIKEGTFSLNKSDKLKTKIIGEWYYVDSALIDDKTHNNYYYEMIIDTTTIFHGSPAIGFYSIEINYMVRNDTLYYIDPFEPILKFEEVSNEQLKLKMLVEPYVNSERHYYRIDSNRRVQALDSIYNEQTYNFC